MNHKDTTAFFLVILLVMMLSSLISGCIRSHVPEIDKTGDHPGSIFWDGVNRTYIVHIPSSYKNYSEFPLVILLHGGGGTSEGMEQLTLGGFNRLSDENGFIVVYPNGTEFPGERIKTRWNDGRDDNFSNADDVGFLSALIDHLNEEWNISEVYVAGISNGAHMTMRLVREIGEKITAVAVVAYAMPEKFANVSIAEKPISILVMTGTKDPLVPWDGGETPDPRGDRKLGKVLSIPDTIKVFIAHNHCSSTPNITWLPDEDPKDGTRVRCEYYGGGDNETEIVLYAIENGGHTWPGGWQYLPEWFVGKTCRDIDANEVIWEFFESNYLSNQYMLMEN